MIEYQNMIWLNTAPIALKPVDLALGTLSNAMIYRGYRDEAKGRGWELARVHTQICWMEGDYRGRMFFVKRVRGIIVFRLFLLRFLVGVRE
jgi:hypothetical protein